MKEKRMNINIEKFERLLAAAAPCIQVVETIPYIKDIPYGSCEWKDGSFIDTRLYTVDSLTDIVTYNGSCLMKKLTDKQLKDVINWAMRKINPIVG